MAGVRGVASLLVLCAGLTACASPGDGSSPVAEAAAPDSARTETPDVALPAQSDEIVELPSHPRGVLELLQFVSRQTGVEFLFDEQSRQKLEAAQVCILGTHKVRRRDLVAWLEAVLSFNNLELVPVDPVSPDDERLRFRLVRSDAGREQVNVTEKDIYDESDRDGRADVTPGSDTNRVREALIQLTSTQADGGRRGTPAPARQSSPR